jgi:hypothetical protein
MVSPYTPKLGRRSSMDINRTFGFKIFFSCLLQPIENRATQVKIGKILM